MDRFIFRSNFPRMRLSWECHDQSQETNRRHCVAVPEVPFFHKRKDILKIDQSVKMPWHRFNMGVACSYSSAPGQGLFLPSRQTARFFVSRPKMVIHLCLAQRSGMFRACQVWYPLGYFVWLSPFCMFLGYSSIINPTWRRRQTDQAKREKCGR